MPPLWPRLRAQLDEEALRQPYVPVLSPGLVAQYGPGAILMDGGGYASEGGRPPRRRELFKSTKPVPFHFAERSPQRKPIAQVG